MKIRIAATKEMSRGVFWVIDGLLFAFPFMDNITEGVAKSGNTYNHKRLWSSVKPKGCNCPYNYYPRGRVEITNKGKAVIYLNPAIDNTFISKIRIEFGLQEDLLIQYDHSEHYKCHNEDGWKPDNSK